jgi:hypothetical protein
MSNKRYHAEWLSLVEVSGPFLTMPVLERVFPQGLDAHDPEHYRNLHLVFEEWEDSQASYRPDPAIHQAWIKFVLKETLALPDEVLAEGQAIPQTLKAAIAEHGETLRPDFIIRNPEDGSASGKIRLLIQVYPLDQNLDKPVAGRHWKASPATRMMELLHSTDVRLGLVTNGEHWMLVDAPRSDTTGFASWYASLWFEEKITLQAFRSLLGAHRFFSVSDDETLAAMLAESARHQQEVTDQLGLQVRRAVEVLVQSLDQADQDHGRELLARVPETVLYEAALTVMMRLVFLFCAEERGLLLLGDSLYDQHYAVSTLVAQLQEAADQHGEEVLERRFDAWVRLLATFRAVYGGVQHERMKLPPYAGNLFNPDRFPFLEGRCAATSWQDTPASPLPVNNRTTLHLLRSLQYLELSGEARRVSFRALDIEQIGHVYEGLLDHTAKRAAAPVLGLVGVKGEEPEVPLSELERLKVKGEGELLKFLREETRKSENALRRALEPVFETEEINRLRAACGNDEVLLKRVQPFAGLVRNDTFDRPVVIRKGSVYVTAGTDRRSSGTHYTPRSLTEPIVQYTLEPLVYIGPAEGKPKEEWQLRSPRELLDLKICDMACGSGAFLVQACRYLSELLVEAWERAEARHPGRPGITPEGDAATGRADETLIPKETDERLVLARRLIAQRCLYGVDKNKLAAEMAKLSLWLLTLAKDKPFTFLDHAIRSGDSLVGITSLDQLKYFSLDTGDVQQTYFADPLIKLVDEAVALRKKIEARQVNTIEDFQAEEQLMKEVEEKTARLRYAADLLVSVEFKQVSAADKEDWRNNAAIQAAQYVASGSLEEFAEAAHEAMQGKPTFHWPLEFPEVMTNRGFDAFIGNPPFQGGLHIRGLLGPEYHSYLRGFHDYTHGNADLCTYFFLRAVSLLRKQGALGLLAVNTIAEGDTRQTGLDFIINSCQIYRAISRLKWPGAAQVQVSCVHIYTGKGLLSTLDGRIVPFIDASLSEADIAQKDPQRSAQNSEASYVGSYISGDGFILTPREKEELIQRCPKEAKIIFPFIGGADLNRRIQIKPDRFIINFYPLDEHDAAKFECCYGRVQQLVKPHRQQVKRERRSKIWWLFADQQAGLYSNIHKRNLHRVLGITMTAMQFKFDWIPANYVFDQTIVVLLLDRDEHFALIHSSIHLEWAYKHGASFGSVAAPRYNPSRCFETFPFPTSTKPLCEIGERYHAHRQSTMCSRQEGLTKTYNRFHNSEESSEDIRRLRELHVEMDNAVAAAYGWTDLPLEHGFHETKQGVRFTISEAARREVLDRLLELNHARYAEEVRQGLHDKKKGATKKSIARKTAAKSVKNAAALFDRREDGE